MVGNDGWCARDCEATWPSIYCVPIKSEVVILTGSVQSMTADNVRCPYCVLGNEFMPMQWDDCRFVCVKCGHIVNSVDKDFVCRCRKCQELDRHSKYGTLPA